MQTLIALSPFDTLVAKLRKKGYYEFFMTRAGFTNGNGKCYNPDDLRINKVYHFKDLINSNSYFNIYVMKDKEGISGYSIDASADFEANEESLYHWFLTKIPKKVSMPS